MNKIKPVLIKFTYIFSAIIAGVLIFLSISSFYAGNSVLKPDFHKNLFEKNNIYSHTQNLIESSMTDFVSNLKQNSPQGFEQHSDIFFVLQKSVSTEMIKLNLDSLRNGLFEYFKGNRQFLPDILLDTSSVPVSSKPISDESSKLSYALTKTDKINLGLILQYINRNDITDKLSAIKLVFYLFKKIPVFSILTFLMLFLVVFTLSKRTKALLKWVSVSFMSCGIVKITAGILLIVYSYLILPQNIYPLTSSIPLKSDILISYIRDCTNYASKFLIAAGIFFIALAFILYLLPRLKPSVAPPPACGNIRLQGYKGIIKYTCCILMFVLTLSALFFNLHIFRKEFYSNDFPVIISKMRNANTTTEVISASDTAVYSFLLRLVDKVTGAPVPNVEINVSGEADVQKKHFNYTYSTDDAGEARFSLDKGTFRVSFTASNFPSDYKLPSPFYFDLKSAGTKIVTMSLEKAPIMETQSWGIAEIEVLDKDNKPVPDLDLSVLGIVLAPGFPNDVVAITNSEGIAAFKLNEGNYSIGFKESTFPKAYVQPDSIDITITANAVTRYTIKLAENKNK
jgi:hypothetical protein